MPKFNMKLGILFAIFQVFSILSYGQIPNLSIGEIQGSTTESPYNGQRVSTPNNVITAVIDDGFFIQSPGNRHDNDPQTSDGIKVFTGTRPSFTPTNVVTVTGTISEENGLTQFRGNDLEILLTAGIVPLPDPIELNESFPAPDSVVVPDLERVEGMLVHFTALVSSPSNGDELVALTTQSSRPFREPGIRFPGQPGLPLWDGNPEIFWLDPDGLGQRPESFLNTSMTVQTTALLTQAGRRYFALPTADYEVQPAPIIRQIRDKQQNEWTVGSLNLFQFWRQSDFYRLKRQKLTRYILETMKAPDILAVQEAGDQQALEELADAIQTSDNNVQYDVYYSSGNGDIHVAFLVKAFLDVIAFEQFEKQTIFGDAPLFDRPPLSIKVQLAPSSPTVLRVLNLHLRSLLDIENPTKSNFVRGKRFEQSKAIANLLQSIREENLMVVGDFNAFEFSDGYVDVVNQITGQPSLGAEFPVEQIVQPALINHTGQLLPEERYSFNFQGNSELLDHCLSNDLKGIDVTEVQFARGNADAAFDWAGVSTSPLRSSDHDGMVAFLKMEATSSTPNDKEVIGLRLTNPLPSYAPIQIEKPSGLLIEARIINIFGQIILREWIPRGVEQYEITLEPSLPAGTYWIEVHGEEQRIIKSFSVIKG